MLTARSLLRIGQLRCSAAPQPSLPQRTRSEFLIGTLVALAGCAEPSGDTWVDPFDGATAIDAEAGLWVHAPDIGIPDGYPVDPSLLTVASLPHGDEVEGHIVGGEDVVAFASDGPWDVDWSYRWHVEGVPAAPRQVQPELPPNVLGQATFSTRAAAVLLEALLDGADLCLLLSEAIVGGDVEVAIGGGAFTSVGFTDRDPLDGTELDADVSARPFVACLDDPSGAVPGDTLRWRRDDGEVTEAAVVERSVQLAVQTRYRWSEP